MRRIAIALALLSTLALAACSSGGTFAAGTTSSTSSPGGGGTASASDMPATGGSGGSAIDCSALTKDDAAKYLVYTQVLAQVHDQESATAVRDKQFTDYTPAAMAAILTKLQGLAGHPAQGFADPKDSLDFFTRANDIMAKIAATTGTVPQSLVDEYKAAVPSVGAAIQQQLPINIALSQACPSFG